MQKHIWPTWAAVTKSDVRAVVKCSASTGTSVLRR
jgi:hypothetical protein